MAQDLNLNNGYEGFGSVDSINDDFIILNDGFEGNNDNFDTGFSNIIEDDNAIIVSDDFFMIEDVDNSINCSNDVDEYLNSNELDFISDSDFF